MIDITNEDIKKSYKQVKTELKNYSSKLSKKKEIIVLNKIDLISKNKLKQIVDNFSKNTKSEIMTLTTLKKNSISIVKAKLISYAS